MTEDVFFLHTSLACFQYWSIVTFLCGFPGTRIWFKAIVHPKVIIYSTSCPYKPVQILFYFMAHKRSNCQVCLSQIFLENINRSLVCSFHIVLYCFIDFRRPVTYRTNCMHYFNNIFFNTLYNVYLCYFIVILEYLYGAYFYNINILLLSFTIIFLLHCMETVHISVFVFHSKSHTGVKQHG